jgi:hypothetical protein
MSDQTKDGQSLIVGQPLLQVLELDSTGLYQFSGSEFPQPLVAHSNIAGNFGLFSRAFFDLLSRPVYSLFYLRVPLGFLSFSGLSDSIPCHVVKRLLALNSRFLSCLRIRSIVKLLHCHVGDLLKPSGVTRMVPHSIQRGKTDPDIQQLAFGIEISIQ